MIVPSSYTTAPGVRLASSICAVPRMCITRSPANEKIICDNPPVAAPPDGFRAHDRAPVLAAELSQSREACREGACQSIIRIVPKTAHPPISVRGRFAAARFTAKAAKFRDMLITDLPRHQRLAEALTVELRIGARPRHRSHVDDEIDGDSWRRSANSTIVRVE